MKKFVLNLDLEDEKDKRRAMKTVAALSGIDEITIDVKAKTLTVIGTVDPISMVSKLRKKNWLTDIISVRPAKELEKIEGPKKDEPRKEEAKAEEAAKDEPKKEEPTADEAKKEEPKKDEEKKTEAELVVGSLMPYRQYYSPMNTYYYVHHSMEENPNACVIC